MPPFHQSSYRIISSTVRLSPRPSFDSPFCHVVNSEPHPSSLSGVIQLPSLSMSLLHSFATTSPIFLHWLSMPIAVDLSPSLLSYIHSSWFSPISSISASASCSIHPYPSHLASCWRNLA